MNRWFCKQRRGEPGRGVALSGHVQNVNTLMVMFLTKGVAARPVGPV